jgi:SAM-dependent methyltransferase
MQPSAYAMLAERQEAYWWHRARRQMGLAVLRRHGAAPGGTWLDIGCGPGGNLAIAATLHPSLVVGVDLSELALEFARKKSSGAKLVRADISRGLPFAAKAYDVATIFNVLYHSWVTSELDVLREVRRVLRPGGLVLITEPAFAFLAREMDVATMGRRRYRRRDIIRLCRDAGLEPMFSSYFTSFGLPLLLAAHLLRRILPSRQTEKTPSMDMKPLHPTVNMALRAAAGAEAIAIGRGFAMPFGITLLCVARRRQ